MLSWIIKAFASTSRAVYIFKARSNGSNMLVKYYPTLLGGVGRYFISVGLCWMLECSNESNTIQQCWISVPGTKLWRIFDHANGNVGRCWMKSLNKVKLHPAPSNTIQHVRACAYVASVKQA